MHIHNVILVLLIVISSIIGVIGKDILCKSKEQSIGETFSACYPNNLPQLIKKRNYFLRNYQNDNYVLIRNHCVEVSKISTCIKKALNDTLNQECRKNKIYQTIRNSNKAYSLQNDYMCKKDGNAFKEMVINGGTEFLGTDKYRSCINNSMAQHGLLKSRRFMDRNVCLLYQIRYDCARVADNLPNKNLRFHLKELVLSLSFNFNCTVNTGKLI